MIDLDKCIRETILQMVEKGELSEEKLRECGASEQEIKDFFSKDLVKIKRELAEQD